MAEDKAISPGSPNTHDEPEHAERNARLPVQLEGWRRIFVLVAVFIGLFLAFLDSTIVSVALATIADDFDDFNNATWVITGYLLTYMAFAIIITRLSDIFGRKAVEVASFVLFIAFSLGCALSQSMMQLILFRAFQGIGGSGLFSMTMVIALNIVPAGKRAMMSGAIGLIMVLSGVLGPILSGAITGSHHSSTWRWIFWLNMPVGGVALAILLVAWPNDKSSRSFSRQSLLSIDFGGCVLSLAASILLIFALQEAGTHAYAWNSATIIASLSISGVACLAFVAWQQWLASHPDIVTKVVFPIKTVGQRVLGCALLIAALSGFVFFIAVVELPQRFQIVEGNSPVVAGVKLLPVMVASAAGSLISGAINSKRNATPYTLITGSFFQLLGFGLMSKIGDRQTTPPQQYAFQIFLGLGFGMVVSTVTIMGQRYSETQWLAVTQGALTQMRSLGGSIGLAVCVIVFNQDIRASPVLARELSPEQIAALFKSPLILSTFPPYQQRLVAGVYASAFTEEMRVATYIAAACLAVSMCTWQRHIPQLELEAPPRPTTFGGDA